MNRAVGLAALVLTGLGAVWMLRRSNGLHAGAGHGATGNGAIGHGVERGRVVHHPSPAKPGPAPNLSAVGSGMAEVGGGHTVSPGGGARGHMAKARRRDATH